MRETIDFDNEWLFHRGELKDDFLPAYKGICYMGAKTERMRKGPASRYYNDDTDCYSENKEYPLDKWEKVSLPHDYLAGDVPDRKYNPALGFVRYDGAWYRKHFILPKSDEGKRIVVFFEGVATNCTVYLNGCIITRSFSGYTPFEADITDYVLFDDDNVLAIKIEPCEPEGWWYEGAGIYRHVTLIKTDRLSVDLYGIYVKTSISDEKWQTNAVVTVLNRYDRDKIAHVECEIIDKNGRTVAKASRNKKIAAYAEADVECNFKLISPELWSPDHPVRYTLKAKVFSGKTQTDCSVVKFGYRSVKMTSESGLTINGNRYPINGVCTHADCGLFGKAVPDNVQKYKIDLIKQMGANAYRTSHYPHAECVMEALDENGFIVMDETRRFESTEESKKQLETLIKRDRNRPSVIFWSIGNEEQYFGTGQGRKICKNLISFIKSLDDSRLITIACDKVDREKVLDLVDVIGINYCYDLIDAVHAKYPDKPLFMSECVASGTKRGWYEEADDKQAARPAWDNDTGMYFRNREMTYTFISERPFIAGSFQWTAFEHRGEAVWPRVCSLSGSIDMFLQKKDAFYQNKSFWTDEPMIHLLPHWNFTGFEGKPIHIVAYTNCKEAILDVNGKKYPPVKIKKYGKAEWNISFCPGYIEAYGITDGKIVCRKKIQTTEKPVALKLSLDTENIERNGKDVAVFSCRAVDKNGKFVPDATPLVTFSATGCGQVLSTGSDNADHESLYSSTRRMYAGVISVAVKIIDNDLPLTLTAYDANGNLTPAFISLGIPVKK